MDGTFTITNFGSYGARMGTPIIRPPEAAIAGFGAIGDEVVPIDGAPAVRPILPVCAATDHRLNDGEHLVDICSHGDPTPRKAHPDSGLHLMSQNRRARTPHPKRRAYAVPSGTTVPHSNSPTTGDGSHRAFVYAPSPLVGSKGRPWRQWRRATRVFAGESVMVVGQIAESADFVVAGAGPGGYVAALRAAQLGRKVTLVDREGAAGVGGRLPSSRAASPARA